MDVNARVDVNCGRKDGRMDGRTNGLTDRRTENRTPMSHLAKAGATKMSFVHILNSEDSGQAALLCRLISLRSSQYRFYEIKDRKSLQGCADS